MRYCPVYSDTRFARKALKQQTRHTSRNRNKRKYFASTTLCCPVDADVAGQIMSVVEKRDWSGSSRSRQRPVDPNRKHGKIPRIPQRPEDVKRQHQLNCVSRRSSLYRSDSPGVIIPPQFVPPTFRIHLVLQAPEFAVRIDDEFKINVCSPIRTHKKLDAVALIHQRRIPPSPGFTDNVFIPNFHCKTERTASRGKSPTHGRRGIRNGGI